MLPILAGSGLEVGKDFFLAFSPERIDPGREDWTVKTTPKVVGGVTPACTEKAVAFYKRAIDTVFSVSSPEAAELTKLLENIFRSVNIALVNELAQLCDRMHVDVWEVVEAAATKPFGFMSFKPGPGLGGHCLPVDPFYLAWKAREFDFYTEFIELAGKVNENMPYFCLEKITRALNSAGEVGQGKPRPPRRGRLQGRRRRPARVAGAEARSSSCGTRAPRSPTTTRTCPSSPTMDSPRQTSTARSAKADCVAIVTAHSGIDYGELAEKAPARGRLPQRDGHERLRERTRMEALKLGRGRASATGAPISRGTWTSSTAPRSRGSATGTRRALERYGSRFPEARKTTSFEDLLDATPSSTPSPSRLRSSRTSSSRARRSSPASTSSSRSRSRSRRRSASSSSPSPRSAALVLMPGHLLLYHPGVAKLKGLVDSEELGRLLYVYGNRQNLGQIRKDENALWSLGAHDLSVILHLVGEEPAEAWARGESFLNPGVEDVVFCYLRFPSGVVAHMHLSWLDPHKMRRMTVVGDRKMAVFDDMEPERKVTVYDKGPRAVGRDVGRVADPLRGHLDPQGRKRRAAPPRVRALPHAPARRRRPDRCCTRRARGRPRARAAAELARAGTRMNRIAGTAVVYPGVELGEDVVIGDYAVVGQAARPRKALDGLARDAAAPRGR